VRYVPSRSLDNRFEQCQLGLHADSMWASEVRSLLLQNSITADGSATAGPHIIWLAV
jgi:hypothetical protein